MGRAWTLVWSRAGRVPLRQKIIGIVLASLLVLGASIAWWVRTSLGGWLSYLLSEERVAQAMSVGTRGVVIITLLAMMVGLVIAWMLTWVLTRPILHITRVAKQVEAGDLTIRAPVWARDEIGELGSAFNAMIESLARSRREMEAVNERLRRRNDELAILYELAGMASQNINTRAVLLRGLTHALEVTTSPGGLVALLSDRGTLPDIVQTGVAPELLSGPLLGWLANHIIPSMAHNEDPLHISADQPETALPPELSADLRDHDSGGLLIAALRGKTDVQGVLVLFGPPDTISESHLSLLTAMCNQLGVTLENSRLWEEVRHKEALRAHLLKKLVSAQEEERRRISRELHDETGQALTSLLVQLKVLDRQTDLEAVRLQTDTLRQLVADSLDEVRRLSLDLRPLALDDLGLIPALEWYIQERVIPRGLDVSFTFDRALTGLLPPETEVVLYRVVQEALTNVSRHAGASHVQVALSGGAEGVCLMVEDDGQGFVVDDAFPSQGWGMGLLGIRERVELIGGRFLLDSTPGQGTRITVEVSPAVGEPST